MIIAVGSDHAGLFYKNEIVNHLRRYRVEVIDVGTMSEDSCNYPEYAFKVGELVASKKATLGIIVCGTGEGVCIAANKVKGVRAGIGYSDTATKLLREHNDGNVITFGQRMMALDDVKRRVDIFIGTNFEGGRHKLRIDMITDYENK